MNKILNFMSLWPPLLGAAIKTKIIGDNRDEFLVSMPLRFYNKNYVGTHYGGSLYSMCDPFFMLILMHKLGKDFLVWDKSASIRFKKPGKGKVQAHFKIPSSEIQKIKETLKQQEKVEPHFSVEIKDSEDDIVAIVEKVLWIKKKDKDGTS